MSIMITTLGDLRQVQESGLFQQWIDDAIRRQGFTDAIASLTRTVSRLRERLRENEVSHRGFDWIFGDEQKPANPSRPLPIRKNQMPNMPLPNSTTLKTLKTKTFRDGSSAPGSGSISVPRTGLYHKMDEPEAAKKYADAEAERLWRHLVQNMSPAEKKTHDEMAGVAVRRGGRAWSDLMQAAAERCVARIKSGEIKNLPEGTTYLGDGTTRVGPIHG